MVPQVVYHKRYRMEWEWNRPLDAPELPPGFVWRPWEDRLVDVHAEVLYLCFRDHMDSQVLPNLGHLRGCQEVMRAIREQPGFCPAATWLIVNDEGAVATVQGILDTTRLGAIQNVGVLAPYRGMGLGEALLIRALRGFLSAGAGRVFLEVTAKNDAALRLYRKHGFRSARTLYKPVEVPELVSLGVGI